MKSAEPEFITIGRILSPWGRQGQLKVEVLTDFPQRFAPSERVYVQKQPFTVEHAARYKGKLVIKLRGIDSLGEAEELQGEPIEIESSQLYALPAGQYYHFQLIGLEVRTTQGEVLGKTTEVLSGASNDVYVVRGPRGEILIPAIGDVVKSIDLDKGHIVVEAIKGLLG